VAGRSVVSTTNATFETGSQAHTFTGSQPRATDNDFIARSDLRDRAYRFALAAHEGERSRSETRIDHPSAVARLLARRGADDEMVAVALLHDVLEDTAVTHAELAAEFGSAIADRVAELSEDASIGDYAERKARLRRQVADAGEAAATIFLADKLAGLNRMDASGQRLSPATLDHYRQTVALLSSAYPDLPFVAEVRHALRNAGRA
jgi:(p)ppGpp synthase/HD superfamily hydrolase